mmetsp:Transcript_26571/g.41236  ORF Transcript_26571/g.41236 Transcript_26571/m.41236 type:complete len:318 (-) Transcript_26571:727-1680(-)
MQMKFTYTLGRTLYIPLTSRCPVTTLPQSRGPGFHLPQKVVASLMNFRRAEGLEVKASDFLLHDDGVIADSKKVVRVGDYLPPQQHAVHLHGVHSNALCNDDDVQHLMTIRSNLETFQLQNSNDCAIDEGDAFLEELMDEVRTIVMNVNGNDDNNDSADCTSAADAIDFIAIAGEGEPTLRPGALLSLAREFSSALPIRVITNGIVHESAAGVMAKHGVRGVSVALMSAVPRQYQDIMQTHVLDDAMCRQYTGDAMQSENECWSHAQVCKFIREALRVGLEVELTGVDMPLVDKEAAEDLGRDLGVQSVFRWRPYFP